jgi:hypothetical protein
MSGHISEKWIVIGEEASSVKDVTLTGEDGAIYNTGNWEITKGWLKDFGRIRGHGGVTRDGGSYLLLIVNMPLTCSMKLPGYLEAMDFEMTVLGITEGTE